MTDEQTKQLARVSRSIGDVVQEFFDQCAASGGRFYGRQIQAFVMDRCRCNAASVDRVMRDLRANEKLNYRIVNRSQSLYEIVPTITQGELF